MAAFLALHSVLEERYQCNFGVYIRLVSGHVIDYSFIGGDYNRLSIIIDDIKRGFSDAFREFPGLRRAAGYNLLLGERLLDNSLSFAANGVTSGDTLDLVCLAPLSED